ncbi:MAG: AI-2E family transporter, partial [Chthoniobacterales bacterium]|nr:AI-2E family transporter [Chthoniobacterales bacterium]
MPYWKARQFYRATNGHARAGEAVARLHLAMGGVPDELRLMENSDMSGPKFRTAFVLILVVAVSALFIAVAWPFLKPLLVGAMFAGLSRPLYRWLTRVLGGRKSLAAALTLLVVFLLIAGPISAFLGLVVRQALGISEHAIPWVQQQFGGASAFNAHDWLVQRFPALAEYVPEQTQIMESLGNAAKSVGGVLVAGASRFTAGTATFLLNLFVMLYAMFFFLRDGRKIIEKIFYYAPLSHSDEMRVLDRLTSVTRATIKGTLMIGAIQGALAGLGFWAAGIEGAAFWSTIM